ncbi:hypothetical protein H5410_061700 [Solanum commersonii]|uniref:Uncharacterized protein n=1 Tax=Solanum commersonii TaxID=4109 RepID=A0A9J5WAE7_SOLCO|nr:hypothetical protein H5410_061700 [Solanum commersonii]
MAHWLAWRATCDTSERSLWLRVDAAKANIERHLSRPRGDALTTLDVAGACSGGDRRHDTSLFCRLFQLVIEKKRVKRTGWRTAPGVKCQSAISGAPRDVSCLASNVRTPSQTCWEAHRPSYRPNT